MNHYINAVKAISKIEDIDSKVQLFELLLTDIDINTIQGMADSEGKSYNGIKKSNQYRDIKIGKQSFVIKGAKQNKLPF